MKINFNNNFIIIYFLLLFALQQLIIKVTAQHTQLLLQNKTKFVRQEFNELNFYDNVRGFEDEEEAINFFEEKMAENQTIGRRVVEGTIKKGWFNVTEKLITNYFLKNNIDLHETFCLARKGLKLQFRKNFEKMAALLPQDSPYLAQYFIDLQIYFVLIRVEPCYMWAQNITFILIKIKFTPKIDIPGFLDVINLNITFQTSRILLSGVSYESDIPVRFTLDLDLYKNINLHEQRFLKYWKRGELGTVIIECLKSPADMFWRNLHEDWHKDPPNKYVWWDQFYQYRYQLRERFGLMDYVEYLRDEQSEKQSEEDAQEYEDRKFVKQRQQFFENAGIKDNKNRQYCWDLYYDPFCIVGNPYDWHSWFFH